MSPLSTLLFTLVALPAPAVPDSAQVAPHAGTRHEQAGRAGRASTDDREVGLYLVQNFSPRDYGQHNGNWALAQDSAGILYVGNTNGVMVFDGVSWQLTPTANRSVARSLAIDGRGRVFVGAHAEIGLLKPDSTGTLLYESLLARLPEQDRAFSDVWQTFAMRDGVYFLSPERLMRWSDEEEGMHVWAPSTAFHVAFVVRDTLYVRQRGVGLLRLVNDGLRLIPEGETFHDDDLFVLLPFGETGMLAVSRGRGSMLYDGSSFRSFQTGANAFLAQNQIYHGAMLSDGSYALATLRGGLAVVDSSGTFLGVLDRSTGIRHQTVWFAYPDFSGGLWLALNDGLSRVEVPSPISQFGESTGLEGGAGDIVRHDGRIHVATGLGVSELVPGDGRGRAARFQPVGGIEAACWSLLSLDEGLLAGCQDRTFLLTDRGAEVIRRGATSFRLYRSRADPHTVYDGLNSGLAVLRLENGRWVSRGRVQGISEQIYSIQEDADGTLWLGTNHEGVVRIGAGTDLLSSPRIDRFDQGHGLPAGWVNAFLYQREVVFGTEAGLFRFGEDNHFERDTSLAAVLAERDRGVFVLSEVPGGDVWLYSAPHIELARHAPDEEYRLEATPLRRLPPSQVFAIYPEEDGVVWIARTDGVVRFDPSVRKPGDSDFKALIRNVVSLDSREVLFGGSTASVMAPSLPFKMNSLRLSFAAPAFDDVSATRYQHRLDGVDQGWSEWTADTYKEYTRLSEGEYKFRVRARDAYGNVSKEAAFAVTILPPWYRAWWAVLLYVLAGMGLLFSLVRWRSHRLELQKRQLQQLVRERTQEIEHQRAQLADQARQLVELGEMKSHFFANVSHEFRTPLTLTIGPLDDLQSGLYGELSADARDQVELALRNARRLLLLINQLLDVARIESGRMTLDARPGDLVSFLKDVWSAFAPLSERTGIRLEADFPEHAVLSRFDPDQLEKVIGNLLSNAFKFTPRKGRIRLSLAVGTTPLAAGEPDLACILVEDTGPGIPVDDLPHVFDRFYQVDPARARPQAGTGIGLSLARELIELHGGRIEVESTEGVGSTFTVMLPMIDPAATHDEASDEQPRSTGRECYVSPGPEDASRRWSETIPPATPDSREGVDGEDVTTIMVIDDNAEIRSYVRRHLSKRYRVLEYPDGASALAAVADVLPDLIICDVMMPGMDGMAFCSAIKSDPAYDFIPIVLLTARAEKSDRLGGWREGADEYVTKPFDMTELAARVENLIASRRRLRVRLPAQRAIAIAEREVVSADEIYLDRVRSAVEEHLEDADFSVDALADAVGQSRVQLYRRLRAILGRSPSEVIREVRLAHARRLLDGRAGTVSEIAYSVGFKSVSHFCRCFREASGVTPAQYMADAVRLDVATDESVLRRLP